MVMAAPVSVVACPLWLDGVVEPNPPLWPDGVVAPIPVCSGGVLCPFCPSCACFGHFAHSARLACFVRSGRSAQVAHCYLVQPAGDGAEAQMLWPLPPVARASHDGLVLIAESADGTDGLHRCWCTAPVPVEVEPAGRSAAALSAADAIGAKPFCATTGTSCTRSELRPRPTPSAYDQVSTA